MYREWKETEFPKEYCIQIWKQQDQKVDQECQEKVYNRGMEEAPENSNGIVTFCTCQWNELIFTLHCEHIMGVVGRIPQHLLTYTQGTV
jgi:hypothetical protein